MNYEGQENLLRFQVMLLVDGDFGSIKSVFLHDLLDISHGAIKFLLTEQVTQLEFGGIRNLVGIGAVGIALDVDSADEVIGTGNEGKGHVPRRGALGMGADVGKAAGGIERLHAVPDSIAVE